MTHRARPVLVTAYTILEVGPVDEAGRLFRLDGGGVRLATSGMLARIEPQVGDYWIIQEDGYAYLNPKDVFERKYEPITEPAHA